MTRSLIVELLGSTALSRQLSKDRLSVLESRHRRIVVQHGVDSPQARRLARRIENDRRVIDALESRNRKLEGRLKPSGKDPKEDEPGGHGKPDAGRDAGEAEGGADKPKKKKAKKN